MDSWKATHELWLAAARHSRALRVALGVAVAASLLIAFFPALAGVRELESQGRWSADAEARTFIGICLFIVAASMHGLWSEERDRLRAAAFAVSVGFTVALSAMALWVSVLEWVDRFGGPTSLRSMSFAFWVIPPDFWTERYLHAPAPTRFLFTLAGAVLLGAWARRQAARNYARAVLAIVPLQLCFSLCCAVIAGGVYAAIRVRAGLNPLQSAAYPALIGGMIALVTAFAGAVSALHRVSPIAPAPKLEGEESDLGSPRTLTLAIIVLVVVAAGTVRADLQRQMGLIRSRAAVASELAREVIEPKAVATMRDQMCRDAKTQRAGELCLAWPWWSNQASSDGELRDRPDRLGAPSLGLGWRCDALAQCEPDGGVQREPDGGVTHPAPPRFSIRVDVRRSEVGDDREDWSILFDQQFEVAAPGVPTAARVVDAGVVDAGRLFAIAPRVRPPRLRDGGWVDIDSPYRLTRADYQEDSATELNGIARQFGVKAEEKTVAGNFLVIENAISHSELEVPGTGLSFRSSYATLAMLFVLLMLLASLMSHLERVRGPPDPWIVTDGRGGLSGLAARLTLVALLASPLIATFGRIVGSAGDIYAQGSNTSAALDCWTVGVTLALMAACVVASVTTVARLLRLRRGLAA